MLIQAIQCLTAGINIGLHAFISVLPLYEEINGLQDKIMSALTGIPVICISAIGLLFTIIKVIFKMINYAKH